jgi:CheY-like chemotaxis protein
MSARRILLVDDDLDIRRIAALSLGRLGGFRIDLAAGGVEALEIAVRDPPDLILLDVSMPGMDGPETLRALRANPATQAIPIVFFTATSSEAEVARLCALGAVAVIPKPFDVADLPRRVRDVLAGVGLA